MTPRKERQSRAARSANARKDISAASDVTEIIKGLRRIVRSLELYSREVNRTYGLTGPQLWALKTLHRDGPLTPNQIAEALAVDPSSVSNLLRRLENSGFIARERGVSDLRSFTIRLTPSGSALAARAPEPAQGGLLHGLRALPPARVRSVRKAIDTLVDAMEVSNVEARFFFSDD
jgi:DNA-binding MarR family transcriptional regulator